MTLNRRGRGHAAAAPWSLKAYFITACLTLAALAAAMLFPLVGGGRGRIVRRNPSAPVVSTFRVSDLFTPANQTYNNVTQSQTANFGAAAMPFNVSGRVT